MLTIETQKTLPSSTVAEGLSLNAAKTRVMSRGAYLDVLKGLTSDISEEAEGEALETLTADIYFEESPDSEDIVVACLLRHELRFSLPGNFAVTEIDLNEEVGAASVEYRTWFREALAYINKADLLKV